MDQPTTPTPPTQIEPLPPTPIPSPQRHRGPGVWRLFFGLIFILIGVQILAQQYGWAWHWTIDFSRAWPVFIILVGLSCLFRPRGRGGWLMPVIVLLLVIGVVVMPAIGPIPANQSYERTVAVAQLTGATDAKLNLSVGATELTLRGGSTQLIDGHFSSSFADLQTLSVLNGEQQVVTLKNDPWHGEFWFGTHRQTLDLHIADAFPTQLNIDAGASQATIDLTGTQVRDLQLDAGAGQLNLTLGDVVEQATVDVNAGASDLNVTVPNDVGVELTVDAGLSSRTLPKFQAVSGKKNSYESDNFNTATKKVAMTIDAGASSITFNWK